MATTLWLAAIVCFTFFFFKMIRFYRTIYLIPSPPEYPVIGCLFHFLSDTDHMFETVRKFSSTYYPIYRLSTFFFSVVVLLEPKDIELVLSSTKHLSKSRVYKYLNRWLGTGLLTSTGRKWHERRKILTPAFHFEILREFVVVFNEKTAKLTSILEKNPGIVNVVPFVTEFTLHSIGETAMGFKNVSKEDHRKYKEAVYRMGQIILQRIANPWFHLQTIYDLSSLSCEEKNVTETLHHFTDNIIRQREEEDNEKKDNLKTRRMAMLDLLLTAKKQGINIDHAGIREEVDTFMFEGHDTTAMSLSFILLTLSNLKEIQDKIFAEIVEIVGSSADPTIYQLQNLKYTERCIKECLRLFPSVPFISRRVYEDFRTTAGYLIPKGNIIHIHIFDIHRNPSLYPDPLKFDPDRFLPENVNKRHPFAYIPFSAGPRNCIGQKYAILELKAALCGILRKFVLEPVDDMFSVKFKADLVLRAKDEIKIKFTPRIY